MSYVLDDAWALRQAVFLQCQFTWLYVEPAVDDVLFFKLQICQAPSTSLDNFAILVSCEQNFPMTDFFPSFFFSFFSFLLFFFFFFPFPLVVLAEAKSVTAQNIQISPAHKDSCSLVNQKYFCQFGAMFTLKSVADYSLCGEQCSFPFSNAALETDSKARAFFLMSNSTWMIHG